MPKLLPSQRNTRTIETQIRHAFEDSDLGLVHTKFETFFEHDHWWVG